jgi:glycerol-3-phosphate dehydrogenase
MAHVRGGVGLQEIIAVGDAYQGNCTSCQYSCVVGMGDIPIICTTKRSRSQQFAATHYPQINIKDMEDER